MKQLIDKLEKEHILSKNEFTTLIQKHTEEDAQYLFAKARKTAVEHYGKKIYIRGLIEFTNYCKNDCYYCGIRRSNKNAVRYRLTKDEITRCCDSGYKMGFRTFVLQGGEDAYFTDEVLTDIISSIKSIHPDCAVTLSLGERSFESYKKLKEAGADRYLLRHETANADHYARLHPENLSSNKRKQCLAWLKKAGFQTGSGFMVGSPFQTDADLAEDLLYLYELKPHMIGIGPFIPYCDTPFAKESAGSGEKTVFLLAILRLMFPKVLLPATTALGTIDDDGREKAVLAGANVVMPNLSPAGVRKKYLLYNDKIATGDEAAESLYKLEARFKKIGYEICHDIGNSKMM